jgi:hypothetical protein
MKLTRRSLIACSAATATLIAGCAKSEARDMKVYKITECTCCEGWVDHLRAAGFKVSVEERADLAEFNRTLGIPDDLSSCHTGVAAGYAFAGHIPAADVKKFLAASPRAKGLAVPGMPINSPGMEVAGQPNERYTVWQFDADGKRTAFAEHA